MSAVSTFWQALSVKETVYIPGVVVEIIGFEAVEFEKLTAVSAALHTPPL